MPSGTVHHPVLSPLGIYCLDSLKIANNGDVNTESNYNDNETKMSNAIAYLASQNLGYKLTSKLSGLVTNTYINTVKYGRIYKVLNFIDTSVVVAGGFLYAHINDETHNAINEDSTKLAYLAATVFSCFVIHFIWNVFSAENNLKESVNRLSAAVTLLNLFNK